MLASSHGTVRVYNAQTGSLEKETNLVTNLVDNCSRIFLSYFPSNERLVIARETEINARTHSNGSVLLHGFLDRRIQYKNEKISLEFYSNQGSVIELFIFTIESLYTDCGGLVVDTHNCPNPKWKTFTICDSYERLYSFFDKLQHSNSSKSVLLTTPLLKSILHRLTRAITDSDSVLFFTAMREPFTMQSEAHRRLTFTHWPHMDYQWITPSTLSEAGFYFPLKFPLDIVCCLECSVRLSSWEPTDEPWSEHIRHSPQCSFVSSPNSKSIPSTFSWSTETAQTHAISDDPIMVLTASTSTDFVTTSTVDGGITIWDLSYFNRRSLEFSLVDVLNASIVIANTSEMIIKSQLQVHSGCLLVSNCPTMKFINLPQPPKIHHLILGCCLPYSVFVKLHSCMQNMSATNKLENVKNNNSKKYQLCLIVIELCPLNSEQVMWIADSTFSSTTTTLSSPFFPKSIFPNQFNIDSIPTDLVKFLPLIGHDYTIEYEELGDIDDNDSDEKETDNDDYEDDFDEESSDKLNSVHTNNIMSDSVPKDNVPTSISTKLIENDFYAYIGLSSVVEEFVNLKAPTECHPTSSTNKLQLKKISALSSSNLSSSIKHIENQQFNMNETTSSIPCFDHSENKNGNSRCVENLPKLVGVIPLSVTANSTNNDIENPNFRVLQILPLPLQTMSFNSDNSAYSQGILVCCGLSRSLSHVEVHHETTADNQSIEDGDLFLFGYNENDCIQPNSVIDETPLFHMKLPNHYCPIQMDVVSNTNDLHVCSLNALYPPIKLQYECGQSCVAVKHTATATTTNNNNLMFTIDSPLTTTETNDLSFCCFILTVYNSLLQINVYKNLSCYAQLIISNPILSADEDNNNDEIFNGNIQFNTFTYCTGLDNICLSTINGEMYIYQLHNHELYKYDMNKQKRIHLYNSIISINQHCNVSSYKETEASFPISSHNSSISSSSSHSYLLNDLYAYCNCPLEQCFILHQLIKTVPIDSSIQVNFPDLIGWYEVDLSLPSLSSTIENKQQFTSDHRTIQTLSKLVTHYIQLKKESLKKSQFNNDNLDNIPLMLTCATLAVQLSLSSNISTHLWEFNTRNWCAYQSLIKQQVNKSNGTSIIKSIINNNDNNDNSKNILSEHVLEISLRRVYSISHFIFHSTLKQYEKVQNQSDVYITLLRKNISSNKPLHFIHNPSKTSTNTECNEFHRVSSVLDHSLVVHDLNAPFIDDEYDSTQSSEYKSQISDENVHFNNELLSNNLKIPGRVYHMPTESIISSERLRELNANIIAGPYLLSDFLTMNNRCSNIPMTSSELIKSRSRFFSVHIKIVDAKNETSSNLDCQSATAVESQQTPLLLSDIFAQIGLSVHQFNTTCCCYDHPAPPNIFVNEAPSSSSLSTNQLTIMNDIDNNDNDGNERTSLKSCKMHTILHERAQRLAILRSMKLHEDCFSFLSSTDGTCNHNSNDIYDKWRDLLTQNFYHHTSNFSSIILDVLNWVVLMYLHELELSCDIVANLLNLAANNYEMLIENVIVHGDRECVQLGTRLLFSLLKLEFIFLNYCSSNNSSYKKPIVFHVLRNCLSTDSKTTTENNNNSSKFIRWLLICQTSAGCETLFSLLDFIISYSFDECRRNSNDLKTKLLLQNNLMTLLNTVSLLHEDFNRLHSSYRLPICLGSPMLLNLPLYKWTYLGSECLQSTPEKLHNTNNNNNNNSSKYQKSFNSTIPSTSNINNNGISFNYENIKNCYPINKHIMNFNGIYTPKSYISFISDSIFNDTTTTDSEQYTQLKEKSNCFQGNDINNNNDSIDTTATTTNDNNDSNDTTYNHSLYLPSSNYSSNASFIHFSDIFTLMRSNFITNIDHSKNITNIILSDLQDWPFHGLLDVEPLKFPLDKLSIQLNDDCDIECVDFFTGEQLPINDNICYETKFNKSQIETNNKEHELTSAISHLMNSIEAYHLVISRMHPGAHRSVTFSTYSSSINFLTDLIIPINPCLQCITLEAILNDQSLKESIISTKLIAISTDISHTALVLRDIYPPIKFTQLRITIVGRLDCPFNKARIHLGSYFGQNGIWQQFIHPLIKTNSNDNNNNLIQYLESIVLSKTMKFISVQQCLINTLDQCDKNKKISNISSDSDNIQISSLYKQCYNLQYQLNWIDRTLNRLRKIYQPEKFREYKSQIHEMSNEQLRMNLYPDKVKYILEHCLLCLLSHANEIWSVIEPLPLLSPSTEVSPLDNEDYTFLNCVDKCCTTFLNDMIIHGNRSMQILTVGLIPMFIKINSILLSMNHTNHNYLYKFLKNSSIIKSNIHNNTRQQLLFWSILQRLIHTGMSQYLLDTTISILYDIWNSIDTNNNEKDPLNLEIFNNILLIIDTIIENGYSSLLTVHKSLNHFLTILNMHQLSSNGHISINGLLKWHYFHQIYNIKRCNAIYPYCQTINSKITNGIYNNDTISQYQLCAISYYRWHLEHLANLSTQYAANHDYHRQIIEKDLFPLGALFVRRIIDSQTSVLMRSCIPECIQQTNTYSSKSFLPLETYQIPQQRFLCMFGDDDESSIENSLIQLLQILINVTLKFLNDLLNLSSVNNSSTMSRESILFQNCFVICRLLGRICWHISGDRIRQYFIPDGNIYESELFKFLTNFCQRLNDQSSLLNDMIIECLCLTLNSECIPECPQTIKPDNYGNIESIDLQKSQNKSWPYPNNSVVNYHLQQTTDLLWHLLPSQLLTRAQSILVQPFNQHQINHIHTQKNRLNTCITTSSNNNGHFVLCEIFSECINLMLKDAKSIGQLDYNNDNKLQSVHDNLSDQHPYLINVLYLFCGIIGEPNFKPWKLTSNDKTSKKCQCYVKTNLQINIQLESLQNVLNLLENFVQLKQRTQTTDQHYLSSKSIEYLRNFYTLTIHFLAISSESSNLRLYILESSSFSLFLNTILTDYSLRNGINRSCTLALEVLFSWFAYSTVKLVNSDYHPFDKFCLDQLIGLFSKANTSTQIIEGPCDLQAVLLTAICSRIKSSNQTNTIDNDSDSVEHAIQTTITTCSMHTISNLPIDYLFQLVQILLNYLYDQLVKLNQQSPMNNDNNHRAYLLCFSCYTTIVDEEYESCHKNFTLWSTLASNHIRQRLISNPSTKNIDKDPNDQSSTPMNTSSSSSTTTTTTPLSNCSSLFIRQLTCCYLYGLCSTSGMYSQILSNKTYHNKCLALILGNLCRILTETFNNIHDKHKLRVFFIRNIKLFLSSLSFAHVNSPMSTMITLSCMINGWKTLKHFAQLIMNHFKPISICDWLFYCVIMVMQSLDSIDSSSSHSLSLPSTTESVLTFRTHLLQSLISPIPLNSCPLFLLLALCIESNLQLHNNNNNDYANILLNTFINDTCNRKSIRSSSSSIVCTSSSLDYTKLYTINASELGQALLQQSFNDNLPYYQQSSIFNFQYLINSLPIGLFGPIHLFKQSSLEFQKNLINFNYPNQQRLQKQSTNMDTTATTCQCVNLLHSNQQKQMKINSIQDTDHYDIIDKEKSYTSIINYQKSIIDFAPISFIYSDILDEQITSLCQTLSIMNCHNDNNNCENIIFPLYLGFSAYSFAPKTISGSNLMKDVNDCNNNTNNDNNNNNNNNNNDYSSNQIPEKFNLSEFIKTNFVFHNNKESLQIIVRLPLLIQLECVQLSVKNSLQSASPVIIEIELYRDLPGASRRTFISAHKSNKSSLSKLHTINFPPRLVSHVLIRLYHSQNYNKTLRVNILRLLGRHANDNRLFFTETCGNSCINANNLTGENSLNKIRPIVLLHLLHNEMLSQLLPNIFYSYQFINSLLHCLHTISSDKKLSMCTRQLIQMVTCHNQIFDMINYIYNLTSDDSSDNDNKRLHNEWFYSPISYINNEVDMFWKSCPSSAILCERILLGLLVNTDNAGRNSLANYILTKLLNGNNDDDDLTINYENVSFTNVSKSNQDIDNEFNSSYWYGPLASLTSTPNQRLFAWLCLHQDVGQSTRIEQIINWLSHFNESTIKQDILSHNHQLLNHWSQLILIFSSVLWSLSSGTTTGTMETDQCSNLWQKYVTIDFISSIFDLYTSIIKHYQMDLSMDDVDDDNNDTKNLIVEIKQFTKVLINLMCSLCTIQPNVISILLSKLLIIPTTSPLSNQYDKFLFNSQLKVFNSILSSDHIVYSIFSMNKPTNSTDPIISNNFFYNCCTWLSDYFFVMTTSESSSYSSNGSVLTMDSALRHLSILNYFMQSNQSTTLRLILGQFICEYLLPSLLFNFTAVLSSLFQSISLNNLFSNHHHHFDSSIYKVSQLQQAIITLYQTVKLSMTLSKSSKRFNSCQLSLESSKLKMNCLTDRLIETFKESFMKQNFKLSNFISELLLPQPLSLTPVPFKQTIAVFAVTSNHPHTSTDLPWPITGPPVVLNIQSSELLKSELVTFLCQEIHQSVSNINLDYSIHPSLSTALLLINIYHPPEYTGTNHYEFERNIFVKHLRLIIDHLLHPFSINRASSSTTTNNNSSININVSHPTEINTMNDFELCLIKHTPNIGHIISPIDWDNGIFLPKDYTDNWTMEQLNQFTDDHPLIINQCRLLCLLIRPCEHAKFVLHPPESVTKPSSSSLMKETNSISYYDYLLKNFQSSFINEFLKSGLLYFIANSIVHWRIPCLLKTTTPTTTTINTTTTTTNNNNNNNNNNWNQSMKQFHSYIISYFNKFYNYKLDNLIINNNNNNNNGTLNIPLHCIITYILVLRIPNYDSYLLNLIKSSMNIMELIMKYHSTLVYLPSYLIQLANDYGKDFCVTNYATYNLESSQLIHSNILPFQCLCYLYDSNNNGNNSNVHIDGHQSLWELRWIHLNSGVLQLILSFMYVLSHGSCLNLPERFDIDEVKAFIHSIQLDCSNNNTDKDNSLSQTIQSINEIYIHFIKPACIDFEHEVFPSITVSNQDNHKKCKQNTNDQSSSQSHFNSLHSSAVVVTSSGSISNQLNSNFWAKGTGFATTPTITETSSVTNDYSNNHHNNIQSKWIRSSNIQHEDQYAIVLCNVLSGFLSTFIQNPMYTDELYEFIIIYFIYKFNLIHFIINYLRNDSIIEIINHYLLYQAIIQLIRIISLCPRLHWLITFVQNDFNNNDHVTKCNNKLCNCFILQSFNSFQSYWHGIHLNDLFILNNWCNEVTIDDDDDDDSLLENLDPSCIAVLMKHILFYLSKYKEQLSKLGLIIEPSESGQPSKQITSKSNIELHPTNTTTRISSGCLIRRPSIRYRNIHKQHIGNLLKNIHCKNQNLCTSSQAFNTTDINYHFSTSKTYGLLQLKSGFYDQFDISDRNTNEMSSENKDKLYTLTESNVEVSCGNDDDNPDTASEDVHDNNSEEEKEQNEDRNAHCEVINDLTENANHSQYLTDPLINKENNLVNGEFHSHFQNDVLDDNAESTNHEFNNDGSSVCVNQEILIIFNELEATYKLLKLILKYQQSSVNKFPNDDYKTTLLEIQSAEYDNGNGKNGTLEIQTSSIDSKMLSTNTAYCTALKSIHFRTIKFFSAPVNNTVSSLVPHEYANLCAQHEGFILINGFNTKKLFTYVASTSTSEPNPDQSNKLSTVTATTTTSSRLKITPKNRSFHRLQRLAQEIVTLNTSLPLSESASIFICCEENHLCLLKALITGPPDTPYANGCFEFDIYAPPDYPNQPPLVEFCTTAKNTFRFNPNLYEDGKVCLSVLNTWHGSSEERWNPQTSSLLQVLVSIQSLIFVREPYFNEPGFECTMGTPRGIIVSYKYNARIRVATVRWAMINQLKHLPIGFEEVVLKHFLNRRSFIISQVEQWILEMRNHVQFKSVEIYVKELEDSLPILKTELNQLEERLIDWNKKHNQI
ncbi:unnamed protein product [Schistosoma rodhaini]|uniref:UBC core domain-containing protein n=1 Tax=Schistosoma rodhaini TaxID=6188 RepID=A0AA85FDI4_9TREM|nr:unnamed protein product [Schistosoma rodhaini]